MTVKDLATEIFSLIGDMLGTYSRTSGRTEKAMSWSSEPRKDLTVRGLEVIITDGELASTALQNNQHLLEDTYKVRLVIHEENGISPRELNLRFRDAVKTLLNAYKGSSIDYIDASDELGILKQAVITLEF